YLEGVFVHVNNLQPIAGDADGAQRPQLRPRSFDEVAAGVEVCELMSRASGHFSALSRKRLTGIGQRREAPWRTANSGCGRDVMANCHMELRRATSVEQD